VKKGGDRQELHERIRVHSQAAGEKVKLEGKENDLIERITADSSFGLNADELATLLHVDNFTGRAKEQTEEYLAEVKKILDENKGLLGIDVKISV
jgi:adenylosuccinate lyase